MSLYSYHYSSNQDGFYIDLSNVHTVGSTHRLVNLTLLLCAEVLLIVFSSSLASLLKPPVQVAQAQGEIVSPLSQRPEVLSAVAYETPDDTIAKTSGVEEQSGNTPEVKHDFSRPPRKEYTIALIGDSMVDTAGERLEYLEHELKTKYPETNFTLYNYGKGSQTVQDGLARLHSEFRHMDRSYPPIDEVKPDIIIVGSFAYNPYTPYDRNRHWIDLTTMVQETQKITPNVYLLAEIAPLRYIFGTGPMGVNWESATVYQHTGKIIEQLQNTVGLAPTLKVPLIDAFTPSITNEEKGGKVEYVNQSDHIHPSVEGHQFMAHLITETIELK